MAFAKASQPATPVRFEVPPHACDCHTHIFGDPARFPFWPGRAYTPETALPEEMSALHRALKMERVVIVTPSVYGTDNSATLYGMKARGANARGVAVIDERTPESDLDAMARAGLRGIRLNLDTARQNDPEVGRRRFRAAAERLSSRNWHIQIFTNLVVISAIRDLVMDSPVPVCSTISAAPGPHSGSSGRVSPTWWGWFIRARRTSRFPPPTVRRSRPPTIPTWRRSRGPSSLQTRSASCGAPTGRTRTRARLPATEHRGDATAPDRRRPHVEPAGGLGARSSNAQTILVDNPARLYGFA